MIAVLAIIGALAAAAVPLLELQTQRARELALRQALRELRTAIDAHKAAFDAGQVVRVSESSAGRESGYPATLDMLVRGVPAAEDGVAVQPVRRVYFLRRLPRDPFADPQLEPARSWGLRASDAPPEAPLAGRDVFDIHSLSERVALDGTRVREW